MREVVSELDGLGRRRFMECVAKSALGVSVLPALGRAVEAAPTGGTAKRLMYLYMGGGMTHLDTFDLKPGHENQGETDPINTSVSGVQISEFLPTIAGEAYLTLHGEAVGLAR